MVLQENFLENPKTIDNIILQTKMRNVVKETIKQVLWILTFPKKLVKLACLNVCVIKWALLYWLIEALDSLSLLSVDESKKGKISDFSLNWDSWTWEFNDWTTAIATPDEVKKAKEMVTQEMWSYSWDNLDSDDSESDWGDVLDKKSWSKNNRWKPPRKWGDTEKSRKRMKWEPREKDNKSKPWKSDN